MRPNATLWNRPGIKREVFSLLWYANEYIDELRADWLVYNERSCNKIVQLAVVMSILSIAPLFSNSGLANPALNCLWWSGSSKWIIECRTSQRSSHRQTSAIARQVFGSFERLWKVSAVKCTRSFNFHSKFIQLSTYNPCWTCKN